MKTLQQNKLYYYLQKLEFTKQQYPWKLYNAGKGSYFVQPWVERKIYFGQGWTFVMLYK